LLADRKSWRDLKNGLMPFPEEWPNPESYWRAEKVAKLFLCNAFLTNQIGTAENIKYSFE